MAHDLIPDMGAIDAEWQAWQDFHKEFERLTGMSVNEGRCDWLVSLAKIWGERMAQLRLTQPHAGPGHSRNVILEEQAKLKEGGWPE